MSHIDDRGRTIFTGQEALQEGARRLSENRKLHYKTSFQDLPISVENRRGSVRRGTDPDGDEWKTKMHVPYGYLRGTHGADGDAVDCFVGPNENASHAYVVHSNNIETDEFDEDKVMLGFDSEQAAKDCFLRHYDDPKFFGGIDAIPMWKFREKVYVKKETTRKLVASRRGVAGVGTDREMRKSILGRNIMSDPRVREGASLQVPEEMLEHGILGMKWGQSQSSTPSPEDVKKQAGHREEQRARSAAIHHGFTKDPHLPGFYNRGLEQIVTHSDGRWTHSSLDHGTTRGHGGLNLHWHLKDHPKKEAREGGPGSGPKKKDIIEKAGGQYMGTMKNEKTGEDIHLFRDPKTGSSLALYDSKIDHPDTVKAHMQKSRLQNFSKEAGVKGMKWGNHKPVSDKEINNIAKSLQLTKDPAAKKVLARRLADLHDRLQKDLEHSFGEAEEHGVKGMKWGVRHARQDGKGQRAPGGKPKSIQKRDLANDPRTMNMMQVVHRSQGELNKISQQQKEQASQKGQKPAPKEAHNEALHALLDLGWEAVKIAAGFTGAGGVLGAVTSIVRSPAGQKLFMHTDSSGNHKLTADKQGKAPVSKRHKASRVLESSRTYYARPLDRYGTESEDKDIDLIESEFPDDDVDFPATRRHGELGMGHFHKKVNRAKRVVVKPDRKNRLTAGVWSEARHALKKKIPVFAIRKGKLRKVKAAQILKKPNSEGHFGKLVFK